MIGCEVDVAVAKSTDLGVSMTRGNSDSKLEPISTLLSTISKTIESNGEANAEFAIREIEKMNKSCETEYKIKKFHWFIDVEMFLNIVCYLIYNFNVISSFFFRNWHCSTANFHQILLFTSSVNWKLFTTIMKLQRKLLQILNDLV